MALCILYNKLLEENENLSTQCDVCADLLALLLVTMICDTLSHYFYLNIVGSIRSAYYYGCRDGAGMIICIFEDIMYILGFVLDQGFWSFRSETV